MHEHEDDEADSHDDQDTLYETVNQKAFIMVGYMTVPDLDLGTHLAWFGIVHVATLIRKWLPVHLVYSAHRYP